MPDVGANLLKPSGLMPFAIASLTPALCVVLACVVGGVWPAVAVFSMTAMVSMLDKLTGDDWAAPNTTSGHLISALIGITHFSILGAAVWAIGGGEHLNTLHKLLIFTAVGLWIGQVSNSNAHELIHRTARWPRRLGVAIYASILFGHHASAHPKVHHIHAATDKDPNSARLNEGVYAFMLRAWIGAFRAGLKAENRDRARAASVKSPLTHPYLGYVGGALSSLLAAYALAQTAGILALIAIAGYAQIQLLICDYVQHYGLRRQILADGRAEPIGPQHSWNAPQWYSSAMMLNAPRHSDHHMRPARSFPALELSADTMPMLPRSLPVMAVLSLAPVIWKRVMNPRVEAWLAHGQTAQTPIKARDISPAVLGAVLGDGQGGRNMPVWDDDKRRKNNTRPDPQHQPVDGKQPPRNS